MTTSLPQSTDGPEKEKSVFQTRVPATIRLYLKGMAVVHYGTLKRFFDALLTQFMQQRPWEGVAPIDWMQPRSPHSVTNGRSTVTNWRVINLHLSDDVYDQAEKLIQQLGVSQAVFCYTAIYWWVKYIQPPKA